jgi:hypothetical protein
MVAGLDVSVLLPWHGVGTCQHANCITYPKQQLEIYFAAQFRH